MLHKKHNQILIQLDLTFNRRVYLRQDYSTTEYFDDISGGFTGIGATHPLKLVVQVQLVFKQEVVFYF